MTSIDPLTLVLSISFLLYGSRCLCAEAMVLEFQRWGVANLRILTGTLELLGALGLIVGQWMPFIGFLAAAGLSLLMVCGVLVRIRIRDSFLQTLPALVFLFVSALVACRFVKHL
jgi:hypothetical protein